MCCQLCGKATHQAGISHVLHILGAQWVVTALICRILDPTPLPWPHQAALPRKLHP